MKNLTDIYYGLLYLDSDGIVKHKMSKSYLELCHFSAKGAWEGYYTTPIAQIEVLKDDIEQAIELELLGTLYHTYNNVYFTALQMLNETTVANDMAYELLQGQQKFVDSSDRLQLSLFEELVRLAVESKVLTIPSSMQYKQWLCAMHEQQIQSGQSKEENEVTIYGFIYVAEDAKEYCFADINEAVVYRKKAEHDKSALFSTAVLQCSYCMRQGDTVQTIIEQFKEALMGLVSTEYLRVMQSIKRIPSVIPEHIFDGHCDIVKTMCSRTAYETFIAYGFRWNVKRYF